MGIGVPGPCWLRPRGMYQLNNGLVPVLGNATAIRSMLARPFHCTDSQAAECMRYGLRGRDIRLRSTRMITPCLHVIWPDEVDTGNRVPPRQLKGGFKSKRQAEFRMFFRAQQERRDRTLRRSQRPTVQEGRSPPSAGSLSNRYPWLRTAPWATPVRPRAEGLHCRRRGRR